MFLKSYVVIFKPEDSLLKKVICYISFIFLIWILLFLIYSFFDEALKLVDTINGVSMGEIYFLKQKGSAFGFLCFIPLLLIVTYMFAHGLINRRPDKKIVGLIVKTALFCTFIGVPTGIISNIAVANYYENKGFINCHSYSWGRSLDFYVYDERFCIKQGAVVSFKVKKWLLQQNGKGEPNLEAFYKELSLYLSEYY